MMQTMMHVVVLPPHRLFGTTGYCSACSKMIPAFEMVMRAKGNVYHLECFACQQCNHRYVWGWRYTGRYSGVRVKRGRA